MLDNSVFINELNKCYKIIRDTDAHLTVKQLQKNLCLIDDCEIVVAECLMRYGLDDSFEPNEYGKTLENVIDVLLRIKLSKDTDT